MKTENLVSILKNQVEDHFAIGLHQVRLKAYLLMIDPNYYLNSFSFYEIKKEKVTEEDIAKNIVEKGLYVAYDSLNCSNTFLGEKQEIKKEDFSYLYHDQYLEEKSKVCTVITVVPEVLSFHNQEYFLGRIEKEDNIRTLASNGIFQKHLPSSFIFGYYIRDRVKEEVKLVKNPGVIFNKTNKEREKIYEDFLKNSLVNEEMLQGVLEEDTSYKTANVSLQKMYFNTIKQYKIWRKHGR